MKSRSEQCKNPKICSHPHRWAKRCQSWNLLQTDTVASEPNIDPVQADTMTRASFGTNN